MTRCLVVTLLLCSLARRIDASARRVSAGDAVMLDVASGRTLRKVGAKDAVGLPGSTLKPFLLLYALDRHIVNADETAVCHGTLRVRGRNLTCVHPRATWMMTARSALAGSCNEYFSIVARRMGPRVSDALQAFGLAEPVVQSEDDAVLEALGLQGRRVSAGDLAKSYRMLALRMNRDHDVAINTVRDGMTDSVWSGMAHSAATDGLVMAGKTGTAPHVGWFAGIVFDQTGRAAKVLVVRVAEGNGDDAAREAHRLLESWR